MIIDVIVDWPQISHIGDMIIANNRTSVYMVFFFTLFSSYVQCYRMGRIHKERKKLEGRRCLYPTPIR
jgi:hypothetical protein